MFSGCDLSLGIWGSFYIRQSLKEQSENDRLGEYLLTSARLAKKADIIVPKEYVIYDVASSEDFNPVRHGSTKEVTDSWEENC